MFSYTMFVFTIVLLVLLGLLVLGLHVFRYHGWWPVRVAGLLAAMLFVALIASWVAGHVA